MLTAYLFDERVGEAITDWESASEDLAEMQVLWLDSAAPSDDDDRRVREAFSLREEDPRRHDPTRTRPELTQHESYIRVTAVAVADAGRADACAAAVLECFVGVNWVVTVHADELEVIEDFRDVIAGSGQLGALDSASFLASLLEWVVASYTREFERIELTLEGFDTNVLGNPDRDVEKEVSLLVEARQRVGLLRRGLEPHRELFAALGHAEFDLVSTERSARRFAHLEQRVDNALAAARDVKESVVNSFDMLILRTEHRTNEIVKVLTLTSMLLLPGSLIAGLMGMNIDLGVGEFLSSSLFWVVIGAISGVSAMTLALARVRHWI